MLIPYSSWVTLQILVTMCGHYSCFNGSAVIYIKPGSRAVRSLGWGPMWVKRGSSGLFNATLAETNLAQSPTLSILVEDVEKFLHPGLFRLRLLAVASLSRGPVCSNESRAELGDWAFNTVALCNHIRSRWGSRVRRIMGNPSCDLFFFAPWLQYQCGKDEDVSICLTCLNMFTPWYSISWTHYSITLSESQVQVHGCSLSVCSRSRS